MRYLTKAQRDCVANFRHGSWRAKPNGKALHFYGVNGRGACGKPVFDGQLDVPPPSGEGLERDMVAWIPECRRCRARVVHFRKLVERFETERAHEISS